MKYTILGFITLAVTAAFVTAQDDIPVYHTLPKYQTPVPYSDQRNWHVTHNLGPMGVRVWLYGHRGNSLESRELMVKSVEPGSPADGILRPYDFILGAAVPPHTSPVERKSEPEVKHFNSDARLTIARAITWAESDRGQGNLKFCATETAKRRPLSLTFPAWAHTVKPHRFPARRPNASPEMRQNSWPITCHRRDSLILTAP